MLLGTIHRTSIFLVIASIITTVGLGVFMAQPWGGNYAYQSLGDYLQLIGLLGWVSCPLLFLATRKVPVKYSVVFWRLIAALVVGLGSAVVIAHTVFFHSDPLGGLIFMFLPVYQWPLIGVFEVFGRFTGRHAAT
jgi:predicted membrane-bound spermidine synthase